MRYLRVLAIAALFSSAGVAAAQTDSGTVSEPRGIFTVYDGKAIKAGDFTFSALPHPSRTPAVQNEKLASKLMGRDMPYRIVLPAGYHEQKDAANRYPVIYLLHGLSGHFDNWTDRTKVEEYSAELNVIIVTPEGEDGWYTDGATKPNDKYESYIIKELIPEVDAKFRTLSDRKHRAIAGLSMGGYGALKFGLKYPEAFAVVGSFSGALGAARFPVEGNMARMTSLREIFGPSDGLTRTANDIFRIVRDITPEGVKSLPFIYLDCGTEDFLFQNNREFVELLIAKKVPHEFRQLPGGHSWPYWDQQVQEFLRIAGRTFGIVSGNR